MIKNQTPGRQPVGGHGPGRATWLLAGVLALALTTVACSEEQPAADGAMDAAPARETAPPPDTAVKASCADICQTFSKTFTSCPRYSAKQCAATCKAAAAGSARLACLTKSRSCSEVTVCLQPHFSAGPYGTGNRDIAGPFTLPTTDGDWSFDAKSWTGKESHLFLIYYDGNTYAQQIWTSSFSTLLAASPKNVHYFFMSYKDASGTDNAAKNIAAMKKAADAALAKLSAADQAHWKKRLHYVNKAIRTVGASNPIAKKLNDKGVFAFAIDRFQRFREAGLLKDTTKQNSKGASYLLPNEARYFDFELEREKKLALKDHEATFVKVWSGDTGGTLYKEVTFPDAAGMAKFDTMLYDMSMYCKGGTDDNCGEWDYLVYVYLCDGTDKTKCGTEIGRWITTYHREGRWVTDVSPLLAHLVKGGKRMLKFKSSNKYLVHFNIRLLNGGKGATPTGLQELFTGGSFNANYNKDRKPVTFTAPAKTSKAQIFAYITGHGMGGTNNCAEFCNHVHTFTVNGKKYVKAHPEADDIIGCYKQINAGVVPNQFGTWPYGRGGWCPGLDVKPFVVDVTKELVSGTNTITYDGTLSGKTSGGTGGNIRLMSRLVFWSK